MLMGRPIGSPPQGGWMRRVSTTRFRPWAKTVRWPRERMGSRKLPAPFTSAGLVEERVIEVQNQAQGAFEVADEQGCEPAPELRHVPLPLPQEAVVGIVGMEAVRIGHVHHAGDGAAPRAERPAGDQGAEEAGRRLREEVGEATEQALPGDGGRVGRAVRRADRGRRGYREQERASVDWSGTTVPTGAPPPSLLRRQRAISSSAPALRNCESPPPASSISHYPLEIAKSRKSSASP